MVEINVLLAKGKPEVLLRQTVISTCNTMLWLVAVVALCWMFHLYARVLPGWSLVLIWSLLVMIMSLASFRRARLRRHLWQKILLQPESTLWSWSRGGVLMFCVQIVRAALAASLLMIVLTRMNDYQQWVVLVSAAVAIAPLYMLLKKHLIDHVKLQVAPELALRFCLRLLAPVMLLALILLVWNQPMPDLTEATLAQALWHFYEQEQARSHGFLAGLKWMALVEGSRLWLGQQFIPAISIPWLPLVGGLLLLVKQGLVLWSYFLLLASVLIWVNRHEWTVEH